MRFLKSRVKSWCFRERSAFEVKRGKKEGQERGSRWMGQRGVGETRPAEDDKERELKVKTT